jgi:hypothetical protein
MERYRLCRISRGIMLIQFYTNDNIGECAHGKPRKSVWQEGSYAFPVRRKLRSLRVALLSRHLERQAGSPALSFQALRIAVWIVICRAGDLAGEELRLSGGRAEW